MLKSLLRKFFNLTKTIIENIYLEAVGEEEFLVVEARPYKKEIHRCPICGKHAPIYDTRPSARRWRAPDLGNTRCYLECRLARVECPEHGVRTERVPWAREGSAYTKTFEDRIAWLVSSSTSISMVSALMRVSWKAVGPICERVTKELEDMRGHSMFDGLTCIGIDETSYKKGHRYMTVVVDHERGCVVWCGKGHGKEVLSAFFEKLDGWQRASIKTVTADGARWIADTIKKYCPNAERVMDPFHVVGWATDVLDELRKDLVRECRANMRNTTKRGPGRPKKGEGKVVDAAKEVKGSRYALLKNPENLTQRQSETLEGLIRSHPALYRGYLLKEELRDVFKGSDGREAEVRLNRWLSRACRSRIKRFVDLSRKVRRHREAIVRAVELGVSNGRVEAINARIKLSIRIACGFRNIDNLIALVMLRCSDLKVELPWQKSKASA
jgi:transposase